MADFTSMLTDMCWEKPSYRLMQRAFEEYKSDRSPCKAGITNQCAVRTSVALGRCGVSLDAFRPRNRVHRERRACGSVLPHVLGAHELARYLRDLWGTPEIFSRGTLGSARSAMGGRTGIVYFNNCFRRTQGGPMSGDHIDLWTGSDYYNEIIRVSAGGDAAVGRSLFGRADAVWFFPLAV